MDQPKRHALHWSYIAAAALALAMVGVGSAQAIREHQWYLLAAGGVSVILLLIGWGLAVSLAESRREALAAMNDTILPVNDRLQQLAVLLTQVSEQQLLSDRAKSVAFRSHDRDALRRAIREDMAAQDWEAAYVLANEMENQFGYKQEAARLREDIHAKQDEMLRKEIGEILTVIDRHTRAEQWQSALQEAEKLQNSHGNHELVRNLPQEIEKRRQATKRQLLAAWQSRNPADHDGNLELLRRLDAYLTPKEAEALQDDVRGVFKARLESLRVGFSSAWQDHRYVEALGLAEQIIAEFPNVKIAQEVAEKLDNLRRRAAEERGEAVAAPAGA